MADFSVLQNTMANLRGAGTPQSAKSVPVHATWGRSTPAPPDSRNDSPVHIPRAGSINESGGHTLPRMRPKTPRMSAAEAIAGAEEKTPPTGGLTDGYNPRSLGIGGEGTEHIALVRSKMAQSEVSVVRAVNEQNRNSEVPTIGEDAMPVRLARRNSKNFAKMKRHNSELRGELVGEQTTYSSDGVQLREQAGAQRRVDKQRRQSWDMSEVAGRRVSITMDSMDVSRAAEMQGDIAAYRQVNEQVRGAGKLTMVGDAVVEMRVKKAQKQHDHNSRVSHYRGEHAGEKTGYSTDATQLTTEQKAQSNTNATKRVNMELRGETAGNPTLYNTDAKDMVRWAEQGREVSEYRAVNEQVRKNVDGVAGTVPVDGEENVRVSRVGGVTSSVRRVNLGIRGEHAGESRYGQEGMAMQTEESAQKRLHRNRRVSWDKSEVSGRRASVDLDDLVVQRSMAQQGEIAKYRQVNEQVTDVGAATINTDAVEFVRAKEGQEQIGDYRRVNEQCRGELAGKSTGFSSDAVVMGNQSDAQKDVHKMRRFNSLRRGQHAGEATLVGNDSQDLQRVKHAPRKSLVNEQIVGYTLQLADGEIADAVHGVKQDEWQPEYRAPSPIKHFHAKPKTPVPVELKPWQINLLERQREQARANTPVQHSTQIIGRNGGAVSTMERPKQSPLERFAEAVSKDVPAEKVYKASPGEMKAMVPSPAPRDASQARALNPSSGVSLPNARSPAKAKPKGNAPLIPFRGAAALVNVVAEDEDGSEDEDEGEGQVGVGSQISVKIRAVGAKLGIEVVGDASSGVFIKGVIPSSPASRTAKLKPGMRILELLGKNTDTAEVDDILALLQAHTNANKQILFVLRYDAVGYAKFDSGELLKLEVSREETARRRKSIYVPGEAVGSA